jgi:hypothetical protein
VFDETRRSMEPVVLVQQNARPYTQDVGLNKLLDGNKILNKTNY